MDDHHTHSNRDITGGRLNPAGRGVNTPEATEALSGPIVEPVASDIEMSEANEFVPGEFIPRDVRSNRHLRSGNVCGDATFDFGPEALPDLAEASPEIEPTGGGLRSSLTNADAQSSSPSEILAPDNAERILIRDRYLLGRVIGTGRDGTIYQARDLRRDNSGGFTDIALKILGSGTNGAALARLKREFAHAQELSHPGIVRVFDIDCFEGRWFLTMELVDGATLGKILRDLSLSPSRRAVSKSITACADALIYAHSRGILHCDFNPTNVVLDREGGVKILGFGAAHGFGPELTGGSPAANLIYCSPNLLRGERPDPRDDVFSYACVSYEWLTGQHPYERRLATEAQASDLQIRKLPGLNNIQFAALKKALSWDRDLRPESIADLLNALKLESPADKNRARPLAAARESLVSNVRALQELTTPRYLKSRVTAAMVAIGLLLAVGLTALSKTPGASNSPRSAVQSDTQSTAATTLQSRNPMLTPINIATSAPQPSAMSAVDTESPAKSSSQVISLTDTEITVSSRASMAIIPLVRGDGRSGALQVRWRTVPGSARPDVDYQPISSGTARFLDRQAQQVLYVPLINHNAHRGDRTFAIRLQRVIGDAQLGITTAHITIRDDG